MSVIGIWRMVAVFLIGYQTGSCVRALTSSMYTCHTCESYVDIYSIQSNMGMQVYIYIDVDMDGEKEAYVMWFLWLMCLA